MLVSLLTIISLITSKAKLNDNKILLYALTQNPTLQVVSSSLCSIKEEFGQMYGWTKYFPSIAWSTHQAVIEDLHDDIYVYLPMPTVLPITQFHFFTRVATTLGIGWFWEKPATTPPVNEFMRTTSSKIGALQIFASDGINQQIFYGTMSGHGPRFTWCYHASPLLHIVFQNRIFLYHVHQLNTTFLSIHICILT